MKMDSEATADSEARESELTFLWAHADASGGKKIHFRLIAARADAHARVSDRLLRTWRSYGALARLALTEEDTLAGAWRRAA